MIKLDIYNKTSFQEKIKIFSCEYVECCTYIVNTSNNNLISNLTLYSRFAATSQILDDFLNFHNASNNTQWQLYAEICSMAKYFAIGAYWQKHLSSLQIEHNLLKQNYFDQKAKEALSFFNDILEKISSKVIKETVKLDISTDHKILTTDDFPSINTSDILECNAIIKSSIVKKRDIVKIANNFLFLASNYNKTFFFTNDKEKWLLSIVNKKISATKVRYFEMLISNLRILFDTCITKKNMNYLGSQLDKLKNYLNITFYLLKMSGSLLRFYEQHLKILNKDCTTNKNLKKELFNIVNPDKLLYWAIEFGLYYVYISLDIGKELAKKILDCNIEISSIKVGVPIKFGFHTRPSLLVAKIVQHYGSKVYLKVGNDKFDASSVLNIQWAGGKIQKEKICEVIFSGDTRALRDIKLLANINYGEDTMGKGIQLPAELGYLK